ncbi:MAG: ATP synthase F1 subunit gamma, partial [Candidatus Falkowbacteria bacterium]|nr:ATP synthase F1 subunit gamma [Candidatus Falkowbacteria bacterium]
MAKTIDIKRRIKSINNTKKITKAMEMIAAAKMRKAIEAVLKTRTYANLSWGTVLNLSQLNSLNYEEIHPLLLKREKIKKIGIVLFTSNRGLCGGFNTAVISKAHHSIVKHHQDGKIETEFILIGKKGRAVYKYYGYQIAAEFPKEDIVSAIREILPVSQMVIADYLSGKYDKIMVAYTDFVSTAKQVPRVRQLLPIDVTAEDEYLGIVGKDTRIGIDQEFVQGKQEKYLYSKDKKMAHEYIFEPNARQVLNEIVPRLIEVQLFQALLESNAAEHSARMSAMQQATDAANEMVDELILYYNKARQAVITAEIA